MSNPDIRHLEPLRFSAVLIDDGKRLAVVPVCCGCGAPTRDFSQANFVFRDFQSPVYAICLACERLGLGRGLGRYIRARRILRGDEERGIRHNRKAPFLRHTIGVEPNRAAIPQSAQRLHPFDDAGHTVTARRDDAPAPCGAERGSP